MNEPKQHTYAEIYAMTDAELSGVLTNDDISYADGTREEAGFEIERRREGR